jgi:hypothetical protein
MIWYFSTLWANLLSALVHSWPLLLVAVAGFTLWLPAYVEHKYRSTSKGVWAFVGLCTLYALIAFLTSPFWV